MTLGALQAGMSALQRICAGRVLFYRESRRPPSLYGVTRGTLASIGPFGELPAVRVGLVAVRALAEYQRFFEVSAGVALPAIQAGVLAFQRILRLRVIEALIHRLQRDLFPSARAMA